MANCEFDSVFKAKIGLSNKDKQNMKTDVFNDVSKDNKIFQDSVNTQIENLIGGSPKIIDTTENILALKENKGIAVSIGGLGEGNWFYWDGTHYVDSGKVYNATQVQYGETKGTSFEGNRGKKLEELFKYDISSNLLNIASYKNGFINPWGNYVYGETTSVGDKIPVEPGQTYSLWIKNKSVWEKAGVRFLCGYGKDGNPIHNSSMPQEGFTWNDANIIIPDNWHFITITFGIPAVDSKNHTYYFCKGTEPMTDERYEPYYNKTIIKPECINQESLKNIEIKLQNCDFKYFKNIYDPIIGTKEDKPGAFRDKDRIAYNELYYLTYNIPVKPNTTIYFKPEYARFATVLDEFGHYIYQEINCKSIKIPENGRFISITLFNNSANPNTIDVEYTPIGQYTPHDIKINPDYIIFPENITEILAYMPEKIYMSSDQTIEIYNQNVCPSIKNFFVQWGGRLGKKLERKLSMTGMPTNVGNYNMQMNIFDHRNINIKSVSTNVIVNNKERNLPFNIVCIGDSMTNGKPWIEKLHQLVPEICSCGTRGVYPVCNEGRSGWTASRYRKPSDATPNESNFKYINPFYNPVTKDFDFSYYMENDIQIPSGQKLDAVIIFLGTNDYGNANQTDRDVYIENMKFIISSIKTFDINLPIFVVQAPMRSNQNGIGIQTNNDGYADGVNNYKLNSDIKMILGASQTEKALKLEFDKIYFIPIMTCFDSEYNYGKVAHDVNPWNNEYIEYYPVESVHPQRNGYYQFADIIKGTIIGSKFGTI